jgi:hypothetical protein
MSHNTALNRRVPIVNLFRRLIGHFWPGRLLGSTGVRRIGRDSLMVAIGDRSYWVHAELRTERPLEYVVWTSDIRDITNAPTIVAAPPAPEVAVPEVSKRLDAYFTRSRAVVSYR